jgi:predicted nucleic acid-binding protein
VSRIRVILDVCVLVPYQLADLLLRIADAELFEPLWSDDLLAEVERNIVKLGVQPDKAARRIAQMASAFPNATVAGFEHLMPAMSTDPKDRHVAAAAVRGGAALIVTANTRDFPPEAMARYDIEVVHPDDFLQDQLDLAEATVLTCLQQHRSAYTRPQFTVTEYYLSLERSVPAFARAAMQAE